MQYRKNPHIYEINSRLWMRELEKKYGGSLNFETIPRQEWECLHACGFDLIWLMGIWTPSEQSQRIAQTHPDLQKLYGQILPGWKQSDVTASPYAIKAYDINPILGTWKELDVMRKTLHDLGMGLILDFVPNHTAIDHQWVSSMPELYINGTREMAAENPAEYLQPPGSSGETWIAHGRDPYFAPWTDTAQLNYFNPDTRKQMIRELSNIAEHCDGVRCDMAMLVLNDIHFMTWEMQLEENYPKPPEQEFWDVAISAIKSVYPDFIFIAEVYWELEWQLQQMGFDFCYDKKLYDRIRNNIAGEVRGHLMGELHYQERLLRFIENHDEERAVKVFGKEKSMAAAVLVSTLPGARLYHQGQLEGATHRIPVQLLKQPFEVPDDQITAVYKTILQIVNQDVFHWGDWMLLDVRTAFEENWTHMNLVAYLWKWGGTTKIVVVNLSNQIAYGVIKLTGIVARTETVTLHDELNDVTYNRNVHDLQTRGLYVELNPYQCHMFDVV